MFRTWLLIYNWHSGWFDQVHLSLTLVWFLISFHSRVVRGPYQTLVFLLAIPFKYITASTDPIISESFCSSIFWIYISAENHPFINHALRIYYPWKGWFLVSSLGYHHLKQLLNIYLITYASTEIFETTAVLVSTHVSSSCLLFCIPIPSRTSFFLIVETNGNISIS